MRKTNKPITKVGAGQKHLNRHFAKKDTHKSNKLMERCSSLDIIITAIIYHFTPTRMAIIKKIITSVSKDMKKSEPLYIVCRM